MARTGRIAFGRMEAVSFGQPAAAAVVEEVERVGAKRVFVMASGTLERETDEIDKLRQALGDRVAGTFSAMGAHTPRGDVIAAADAARVVDADLIVTFGGGSVTDGAKAVGLCLANDIQTPDAMDMLRTRAGPDGKPLPPAFKPSTVRQISVPTTLSAGEFSALSGVTDERSHKKELFTHPSIMPLAVVLDPTAARHTPEWLFLSTGIRAVDHCVEGVSSGEAHAFGDAQGLQGLSLLARGLPRVKADPDDIAARLDCQMGAWMSMGPLASGVPMGASHGIGYVLGAAFGIPHGHTSCIMLPAVMRWNKTVNAARQALVSGAMADVPGAASDDAGDKLDAFIAGLDMPRSLGAVDIGPEHFQSIAEQAMGTPWVPRNPRPIGGPEDVVKILELAA